jgi:poly(hydroxyalkanoate) depolymerase family esterase
MNADFASAMRAVAKLTRAQKLVEATRLIQTALSGNEPALSAQDKTNERTPNDGDRHSRKPLAVVVNTLRRAKQNLEAPARKTGKSLDIPKGAHFLSGSFSCPAGSRDYRLYIPSSRGWGRRPLIVMLHGCKQNPVDFAIGTRMNAIAEQYGMFVLYPAQASRANPMSCWNWFNPKDQIRDSGEPAIVSGMTRQLISRHNIDPDRVFVAGLSAGGAMAAVLGATYPDLYAAIGVHSGLPYKAANDAVSAFAAMRGEASASITAASVPRIRTIVFHGDADQTVHPSNAAWIITAQAQPSDVIEKLDSAGPQTYSRKITRDADGKVWNEQWLVHGARHGWSGGSSEGSFTDARGPDASRELVRFFLEKGP